MRLGSGKLAGVSKNKNLFKPGYIGNVRLKNRLVVLPMALRSQNYGASDGLLDFYSQLAIGDAGMVVIGSAMVCNMENACHRSPDGCNAIRCWDDSSIPVLANIARLISQNGAVACAQLSIHYEWRATGADDLDVVGPSNGLSGPFVGEGRALTKEEISLLIGQYGDAAARCRKAGIPLVEIHAGMGYLLSRFLSSSTNHRTDEYGGSFNNRLRIIREVIADCKAKAGDDYPIVVRMNIDDFMPDGNTLKDSLRIIKELTSAGVSAFSMQSGFNESDFSLVNQFVSENVLLNSVAKLKESVGVPLIAAHRIAKIQAAERALKEEKCDFVGMARAFIADPFLAKKARTAKTTPIRPCVCCCRCLDGSLMGRSIRCTMNAQFLSGYPLPEDAPIKQKMQVLVVGAGAGGLEAARVAAVRGCRVMIWERGRMLGGSLGVAAVCNPALEPVIPYYRKELQRLRVQIIQGSDITKEGIEELHPDVVIVAVGGSCKLPNIPGIEGCNVVSSKDVTALLQGRTTKKSIAWRISASLLGRVRLPISLIRFGLRSHALIKKNVVIVGGQFAGCETALALMDGRIISVVDEEPKIAVDLGPITRRSEMRILQEGGVKFYPGSSVEKILPDSVLIKDLSSGKMNRIEAETVIIALGIESNHVLYDQLRLTGSRVFVIGDAVGESGGFCLDDAPVWQDARRLREAIRDGFEVAMEL